MMNLLARIFSHGFAFAVVAIIVIVLIYRGEFSPGWKLPEFLVIKSQSEATAEADSGTVERTAELPAITPEPLAEPTEPLVPTPATAASEDIQPAEEVPAAVEAIDVTPATSSDSAPATDAHITVAADESSVTEPAASTEGTDQATDDATVPGLDELNDEPGTPAGDSLATATEEMAPEVIAPTAAETPPEEAEPVAADVAPVEAAPIVTEEPASTPEITPATEPLAAPGQEEMPETVDDTPVETPYEVMAKARESYWLRDFDAAEQHYRTLTQIDPDNPDGYGEMGNMYFSQGKWDDAAAAFYEAGTRLVKSGHVVQAQQLVEVIRGLNGPQADGLQALVDAASN